MRIFRYSIALSVALVVAALTWHWLRLPPIARGPDREYGARVRSKFRIGMDEADLVRQLHDQGFSAPENWRDLYFRNSATGDKIRIPAQDPALKYATFSSFSLPFCDVTWWVLWHSNQDGKITDVRGNVGASCL